MTAYRVHLFSDPICPWCFIGWAHFLKARPKIPELAIVWRAYQLNPTMVLSGMRREAYLRRKFGMGYEHVLATMAAAGRDAGIEIDFDAIERTPNTVAAHLLVLAAQRESIGDLQQACMFQTIDLLFRAYFIEGKDIGDGAVLLAIAAEVGIPQTNPEIVQLRDWLEVSHAENESAMLPGDEAHSQPRMDFPPRIEADLQLARRLNLRGVPNWIMRKTATGEALGGDDPQAGVGEDILEEIVRSPQLFLSVGGARKAKEYPELFAELENS